MRGLEDQVSIVVGAAPGNIGAATVERLASEGSVAIAVDIDGDAAAEVAAAVRRAGGTAFSRQADIASVKSYEALITSVVDEYGGIDNLFQAAAALGPDVMGVDSTTDVESIPLDVWQRTIEVTLTGYMIGAKLVLPVMRAGGGGSIVNTMSDAAWMAEPVRLAYGAAKLGIAALTRHVATVGGPHGIRCNSIAPGVVMTEAAIRTLPPEMMAEHLVKVPVTRLGQPSDIAGAVAFLCSNDGAWITGQTLRVDGGLIMR
jgi:NAD(P)-dependent dehydrogenase (short-subunit alcohol dehydrogenase family)